MKGWIKYTAGSIAIAAMLAGGIVLLHGKRGREAAYACSSLEVSYCEPYRFISEEDINTRLVETTGPYVGQRMSGFDLDGYERSLRAHPFVESAEVWMTPDGTIHAMVDQKEAVARIRSAGGSFYIDPDFEPFPLSEAYAAPVRVFEGDVNIGRGDLRAIGKFNAEIEARQKWDELIDSVHVGNGARFSFILDNVTVCFGTCRNADEKFSKLERYVEKIAPLDNGKKVVDLQYKGQIICK